MLLATRVVAVAVALVVVVVLVGCVCTRSSGLCGAVEFGNLAIRSSSQLHISGEVFDVVVVYERSLRTKEVLA